MTPEEMMNYLNMCADNMPIDCTAGQVRALIEYSNALQRQATIQEIGEMQERVVQGLLNRHQQEERALLEGLLKLIKGGGDAKAIIELQLQSAKYAPSPESKTEKQEIYAGGDGYRTVLSDKKETQI